MNISQKKGKVHYLIAKIHGKKTYYRFVVTRSDPVAEKIPDKHEIYQSKYGRVHLFKNTSKTIKREEIVSVINAIEKLSNELYFKVEISGCKIIVSTNSLANKKDDGWEYDEYEGMADMLYTPILRFILNDRKERDFIVERYCFRGSVDG